MGHAVHTGGPGPSGAPGSRAGHRHGALSWSEARATAARAVRGPLAPEIRQLPDALGTVLAEPLTALTDLPSFDSSAMDGWAVSGPGPWRIATGGHGVLAGDDGLVPLEDGHAVRIATGARVPPGTTGVLRSEYGEIRRRPDRGPGGNGGADRDGRGGADGSAHSGADSRAGHRNVPEDGGNTGGNTGAGRGAGTGGTGGRGDRGGTTPPAGGPHGPEHGTTGAPAPGGASLHTTGGHTVVPGQDIRPRGQECRSGDRLLAAGTAVTPAVLGLAAAAGYDELRTVRRPRVEVLVLGDELLHSGLPRDGRIRDALGPMLGPWLETLGAEVTGTYRLGDDAEVLHTAVTASAADVIVTTGGTAAGPVDHVHPVLRRAGAEVLVDGVAVRPGHPMLLARLAPGRHLVGLPGNPLAAVSGLLTLVEPLLRALCGRAPRAAAYVPLAEGAPGHPRDTRLVPVVRRTGTPAASPSGRSGRSGHPGGRAPGSRGTGARSSGNTGAGTGHRAVPLRFNGPAMLRGIAAADGLAVVPPGGAEDGSMAEILELPWFEGETE
ncbi:molybdopterin molybdotransferase MoeA [Streptomyces xinghaiensis]